MQSTTGCGGAAVGCTAEHGRQPVRSASLTASAATHMNVWSMYIRRCGFCRFGLSQHGCAPWPVYIRRSRAVLDPLVRHLDDKVSGAGETWRAYLLRKQAERLADDATRDLPSWTVGYF